MENNDQHWNSHDDPAWDESMGIPIVAVHPFVHSLDFEWLILSLSSDHAKVVLIRHFGLRGKKAAKAAGFSSEWSLYRREHELKKVMERKRDHFFG